jgi:hypothetical protein
MSELVQGGYDTETLESKIRHELTTNPKWVAKLDKTVESVEESKREVMRELLIESYICDLVLSSHAYEGGYE